MNDLFRLAIGDRRSPEVAEWFDSRPDELGLLARDWFSHLRNAGDDVLEMIHDGCPVACVEDAPFGYVNVFTSHVNVGFFRGAFLPDPDAILLGTGKRMRHVKVSPVIAYDAAALERLVADAYADIKHCLDA